MDAFDVDFGNFHGKFEPDEFYESFQAPKFHDFTAPEVAIDPDAFFNGKPGMLKKAAEETTILHSPKIHKVAAPEAKKTAQSTTPGSLSQQAPPKTPVAAEKAVSAGSAKKIRAPVSTSLTPLTSKTLKSGNSSCESPSAIPTTVEKHTGSLKPTSLVRKLQASENEDPNSTIASNSPAVTPVKAVKHTKKLAPIISEDKPLTRTRSLKILETKAAPVEPESVTSHKVPAPLGECVDRAINPKASAQQKEAPNKAAVSEGAGVTVKTVISKVGEVKPAVAGPGSVKDQSLPEPSVTPAICKTPVKEPASHPEHGKDYKKVTAGTEVVGSPYNGHHCKSSRCAANNPDYASPSSVPTRKYLIARRGTPGSIRKLAYTAVKADSSVLESTHSHNGAQETEGPSPQSNVEKDKTVISLKQEGVTEAVSGPNYNGESTCGPSIEESQKPSADGSAKVEPEEMPSLIHANGQAYDTQVQNQVAPEKLSEQVVVIEKIEVCQVVQEKSKHESMEFCTFEVLSISKPELEGFKKISLGGSVPESTSQMSDSCVPDLDESSKARDTSAIGDSVGNGSGTVRNQEKESHRSAGCTEEGSAVKDPVAAPDNDSSLESKLEGVELFLHVASDCLEKFDRSAEGTEEGSAVKYPVTALDHDSFLESKLEGVELFLHVASDCLEKFDMEKTEVPQSKQGKKRKSKEMDVEGGSKRANCSSENPNQSILQKGKGGAPDTVPCVPKLRKRVTSPRPFRLRTQERGALKEIEFNKRMEEYIAAREGFHSAFQGLSIADSKLTGKTTKPGGKDQVAQPGHVFCAKRAEPSEQDGNEDEAKKIQKVPHAQKLPTFDRPFKPHRSTKKLTVPQEPKFHLSIKGRRTCGVHPAVPI